LHEHQIEAAAELEAHLAQVADPLETQPFVEADRSGVVGVHPGHHHVLAERLPGDSIKTEEQLFDYGCANAKTDHHPVGTCKMGTDAEAVVDLELKVRGLEGLRVCDSSVMPRVPSCNTNGPTIMVGEKGADIIRNRAPLPPTIFSWERNDTRPRARADVR